MPNLTYTCPSCKETWDIDDNDLIPGCGDGAWRNTWGMGKEQYSDCPSCEDADKWYWYRRW